MKILILGNSDLGLFRFRKELIDQLLLEKQQIFISVPKGEYVNYFIKKGCIYKGIKIDRRGTNPVKDFFLFLSYWNLCRTIKPDIILTYTVKPSVYGGIVARFKHIPYIVNITGTGSSILNGGWKEKLVMILYRISLKRSKCVFFQNRMNYEQFILKNITIPNFEIIPGSGVNINEFSLLEYPLNDNIEFAFIGRVLKDKGIDEYLKAASEITKKHKNVVFNVCGPCEDNYYKEILQQMHANGIIHYHGMVKEIKKIYKKIHCLILPSYSEGMSNTILEAAASGRPAIVTDIAGCREAIEDLKTGYLIEKKNYKDLVQKIESFIVLPWEKKRQMGIAGREKMVNEFDREIVIQKYVHRIMRV